MKSKDPKAIVSTTGGADGEQTMIERPVQGAFSSFATDRTPTNVGFMALLRLRLNEEWQLNFLKTDLQIEGWGRGRNAYRPTYSGELLVQVRRTIYAMTRSTRIQTI